MFGGLRDAGGSDEMVVRRGRSSEVPGWKVLALESGGSHAGARKSGTSTFGLYGKMDTLDFYNLNLELLQHIYPS